MRIKNIGSEVRHPKRNAVASIFVVEGGRFPAGYTFAVSLTKSKALGMSSG
jgi:hypothetical protein